MPSVSKNVKVPEELYAVLPQLARICGYENTNAFLVGAIREAAARCEEQPLGTASHYLPLPQQDRLDSALARRVRSRSQNLAPQQGIDAKHLYKSLAEIERILREENP